jgi:hypothetical protein
VDHSLSLSRRDGVGATRLLRATAWTPDAIDATRRELDAIDATHQI